MTVCMSSDRAATVVVKPQMPALMVVLTLLMLAPSENVVEQIPHADNADRYDAHEGGDQRRPEDFT